MSYPRSIRLQSGKCAGNTPRRVHFLKRKNLLQWALMLPLLAVVAISALQGYSLLEPADKAGAGRAMVASVHLKTNALNPADAALNASLSSGMNVMDVSGDNNVDPQAVPEPSSWALGLIVAALFGFIRFRRVRV